MIFSQVITKIITPDVMYKEGEGARYCDIWQCLLNEYLAKLLYYAYVK